MRRRVVALAGHRFEKGRGSRRCVLEGQTQDLMRTQTMACQLIIRPPTQCRDLVFVGALVVLYTEVRGTTNTARMILTWE
jgi:hypothetical protein